MNSVQLLGRLGADAELKVLANGSEMLKFSLATSEKWTDKTSGEKKERTEWHRCNYFSKGASKLAPYLLKGSQIAIQGSISYGSYEKDGVKIYTTDIRVNNVEFAGSKPGGAAHADPDGLPLAGDEEPPF